MGMSFTKGLFYGPAKFEKGQDLRLVDWEIRTKQIYGAALVWINYLLVVLAAFISLVNGFCTGGAPVTFGSMPHMVWYIPSLVILPFALLAFYFDSTVDYTATSSWLMVGMWFIIFLALINLIHAVALIIELSDGTSIFYMQDGAAWVWVLMIVSFVFVLWEAWIAWRMYVYRHDVVMGEFVGWRPGMKFEYADDEETPSPSAPTANAQTPPPVPPRDDTDLAAQQRVAFQMPASYNSSQAKGVFHAAAAKVGLVTTAIKAKNV